MSWAIIEVTKGPHKGVRLEIDEDCFLYAGRDPSADICLVLDPFFSQRHFCLEVTPPRCKVIDLDSKNGTYVNHQAVKKAVLKAGDIISGGTTEIRFNIRVSRKKFRYEDKSTIIGLEDEKKPVAKTLNLSHDSLRHVNQPPGEPEYEDDSLRDIPGYSIKSLIGKGGMGAVFLAIHEETGKEVALKVIIPEGEGGDDEDSTRLFVREASVISQLKHPRIVEFMEFGQIEGRLFLAMEYVKQVYFNDLAEKLDSARKIRLACGIICQVLEGLDHAHKHSLVHRDIKPSNILLTINNKKPEVKISDFGLAKNYMTAGYSGITGTGDIRGTLFYMPPEQILNSRDVKPTADIYAVGATLYNYLSRNNPYDNTSTQSGIQMILHEEIVPLNERCPELPGELVRVVHKALSKEPENRFRSAKEMYKAVLPFTRYNK